MSARSSLPARTALSSILLLFLVSTVSAQQYPFLPVTAPNAPKNIQVLFQDSRGMIWVGTKDDLLAFDGTHFYSLRATGYPEAEAKALAESSDGEIWSATQNGIFRFHRGKVEQIADGFALSVLQIGVRTMLAVMGPRLRDAPDQVVGAPRWQIYLIRMTGDTWNLEPLGQLKTSGYVTVDHQGTAIYPCTDGWCEITRDQIARWNPGDPIEPAFHAYKSSAQRILRDRSGCMWFRSTGGAGYQCPGEAKPTLWAEAGMLDDGVRMTETPDGWIVISGGGRLGLGRPLVSRIIRATNGLPETEAAIEARDGTWWLGGSKGLYRLAHNFQLEYWSERDGLENPLSVLRVGERVYAASGLGIKILSADRQNWRALGETQKLGLVLHLSPGPGDTIYAAFFQGVAQIDGDGKLLALSPTGDRYAGTKLLRGPGGDLWLNGIGVRTMRLAGRRIAFGPEQLLVKTPDPILQLDAEYDKARDRLWVCGPKGISVRHNNAWREITAKEGMLQDFCLTLAVSSDGDAWYGYGTLDVFDRLRLDDSGQVNIQHFPVNGSQTRFFDADQRGWLWRGGADGVFAAAPDKAAAGEWRSLRELDGLPAVSTNQQSFYSDPDGSVWFAADNTITHFRVPQNFLQTAATPELSLTGFSWDGGPAALVESLGGIPHSAAVTARIGSLFFDERSDLQMRYRLVPDQKYWKEINSFDLALGKPAWGKHQLQVEARIGRGPWSATTQEFRVEKPAWLAWPALLSFALLGAITGVGIWKWDVRRKAFARNPLPDLAPWRLAALMPEVQKLTGALLDGRYEVGKLLARGGFANVLEGYDRKEQRRCAIKVFRSEIGKSESVQQRFEQEVSALQQVKHATVVAIYAHGTTSGVPFLVMEFVEGKSLREILNGGALAPRRAAVLVRQIAEALEIIHGVGICHRDLKPENVMIRNPGSAEQAVLIDFSIALVKEANETLHGLSRAAGTFEYMAPEQAIGYAEPSSDVYSLAKVLLEMLTGTSVAKLLPKASMDLPARARELAADLPAGFSEEALDAIASALEFDPSRRPASAAAFAELVAPDLEIESKPA
ncbi:MAG TPA: serine/threonine-protein kinase [Candidatus Acidoferrales bacterium]|nr:serine/threonine-protein kinase [Candidatus Acidoferrales bacterium]